MPLFRTAFTGQATRVWRNQSEDGKQPTTRVQCKDRVVTGTMPDGSPRYREEWVTLVGWKENADALARLKPGDLIWAEGKIQPSKPYQSKNNGEWYAGLDLAISSFALIASGDAESAAKARPAPKPEPDDNDDQFAF